MEKELSESQALRKIASYCAYQERCEKEVRQKLRAWELPYDLTEKLVQKLLDEDFMNEERYAGSFVRGKFGSKKWGKIKIRHGLQQHGISEQIIRKALAEIDFEEYRKTLFNLAEKKQEQLKNPTDKNAVYRFLTQRGFESELISQTLKELDFNM